MKLPESTSTPFEIITKKHIVSPFENQADFMAWLDQAIVEAVVNHYLK